MRPSQLQIPDSVPVFPLPNMILFPGVDLPLYIFEPRYRKMLSDCFSGHKFMAISLLKQGWESKLDPVPSYDVVGVGYVRAAYDNPDGTSHIILKGICRAKILRYAQMEPYRIAKIKLIPDKIEDQDELNQLAKRVKRLVLQKLRFSSENPQQKLRLPKEYENPLILSHVACFLMEGNAYLKQDLLETTNANSRLRRLVGLFGNEICPMSGRN